MHKRCEVKLCIAKPLRLQPSNFQKFAGIACDPSFRGSILPRLFILVSRNHFKLPHVDENHKLVNFSYSFHIATPVFFSLFQEVKRYERERRKNKSTYWITHELLWRDFVRFGSIYAGHRINPKGWKMPIR